MNLPNCPYNNRRPLTEVEIRKIDLRKIRECHRRHFFIVLENGNVHYQQLYANLQSIVHNPRMQFGSRPYRKDYEFVSHTFPTFELLLEHTRLNIRTVRKKAEIWNPTPTSSRNRLLTLQAERTRLGDMIRRKLTTEEDLVTVLEKLSGTRGVSVATGDLIGELDGFLQHTDTTRLRQLLEQLRMGDPPYPRVTMAA